MNEKIQPVQEQTVCWDAKMKEDAMDCVAKLSRQVRRYLSHAIEYANTSHNEPKEQFWTYLFWDVLKDPKYDRPIMTKTKLADPNRCPENPYRLLQILVLWESQSTPPGRSRRQLVLL